MANKSLQKGQIVDGYYFKGGKPADKANWVKAPEVGEVMDGLAYQGGDPSKKENWKESLVDFSGFAEGTRQALPIAGAIGGGLLGAPLGPAGMVAGAALGGAAGSMASGVGKAGKEFDPKEKEYWERVGAEGLLSAAGEGAGQVVGKLAKPVSRVTAPYIKRATKRVGEGIKKIASSASRTNQKAMDVYLERTKQVDKLIREAGQEFDELPRQFKEKLRSDLRSAQNEASRLVGDILENPKFSKKQIQVKPIRDFLLEQQKKINKVTNPADYAQIEEIINRVDILSQKGKMSAKELHDVKRMLYDISKGSFQKPGEITKSGSFGQSVARQAARETKDLINKAAPDLKIYNEKLAKIHEFQRQMPPSVLDPAKTPSRLMTIGRGGAPELAKTMEDIGPEIGRPGLLRDVEDMYAARQYYDPDLFSGSFTGRSALMGGLGGLGAAATGGDLKDVGYGALTGAAIGSPALQKQFIRYGVPAGRGFLRGAQGMGYLGGKGLIQKLVRDPGLLEGE